MVRRLLRCGLLSAALLGLAPLAVAKPPDLPAELRDIVTPAAAPAGEQPNPNLTLEPEPETSIFDAWRGRLEPQGAEEEVPFYRLHLANRKLMTSCLLLGVHPLLALAPTDEIMYWPMEIREALEDAAEETGAPAMPSGAGDVLRGPIADAVISAAAGAAAGAAADGILPIPPPDLPTGMLKISLGVSTSGGVTGSVDMRSGVSTRSVTFGLGMNSDGGLTGNLDLNIPADEVKTGFMNLLRTNKSASVNSDGGLSGSIMLNERNFDVFPAPVVPADSICPALRQPQPAPAVPVPERTVLENLKALEEGDRLIEQGKEMLRTGRLCEALDSCAKVGRLCPGSRCDEMAHALAADVLARWFDGTDEEAKEDDYPAQDVDFCGTPIWRILADILCGQGLNVFPEKPAAPPERGEGQEIRLRGTKETRRAHDSDSQRAEQEIVRHLNLPVTLQYCDVPLTQVLEDLRHAYGLRIVVDERALADKGTSAARQVTLKMDQVCLKTALKLILKNLDLAYVIEDGVIHITTPEAARGRAVLSTYAVADLVVCEKGGEQFLIRVITNTVSPADWAEAGGTGTIDYHPLTQSLVVRQTADVHEQIADLLAALRRLNEAQKETVAGSVPAGIVPVEAGARVMADGLLKAARLALESGDHSRATDLARQAYALDPMRMKQDAAAYSLYLLVRHEMGTSSRRINNCGPDWPLPTGCESESPWVCPTKSVVAPKSSLRRELPGVDPRVVAAMAKVLAEAEAKRPRLILVVEEEQESRVQAQSVEIAEPFMLDPTANALKALARLNDMAAGCGMRECGAWMNEAANFRLGILLTDREKKSSKMLTFGLLGWFLEDSAPAEDDE
jgi:hypothetical protein